MTAPTPRETVDHAELARLAEAAENNATPLAVSLYRNATAPHHVLALLSEIAALRGKELLWIVVAQKAQEDRILADQRATQAERQRDEAVGLLRPFAALADKFGCWSMVEVCAPEPGNTSPVIQPLPLSAFENAAAFLANQGADQ